jgi:hypothetical protein
MADITSCDNQLTMSNFYSSLATMRGKRHTKGAVTTLTEVAYSTGTKWSEVDYSTTGHGFC